MKRIFNEDSIIVSIGSQDMYPDGRSDMGPIQGYMGVSQAQNCPKCGKTVFFHLFMSPNLLHLMMNWR